MVKSGKKGNKKAVPAAAAAPAGPTLAVKSPSSGSGHNKSTPSSLPAVLENLSLDSDGVLGDFGAEELSPRLLALQQQLERLDQDRYLLQRATEEPALNSLSVSATKTELSLQSLKKRLSEVRQQLYGATAAPSTAANTSLADLAKSYFGGMIRGKRHLGFPGEGEAFDEIADAEFDFEVSESEFYEDELLDGIDGIMRKPPTLEGNAGMGIAIYAGGSPSKENTNAGVVNAGACDELLFSDVLGMSGVAKPATAEEELEAALDMIGSSSLPSERKLEVLKEKFANIVKHDRHWRARVQRATRVAHDERIQRQLIEMELEKANAIKQRLESLCRDLHNENRRIKAAEREQKEKETAARENSMAAAASLAKKEPPVMEFPLAALPSRDVLSRESSTALADRITSMADLYLLREQHFAMLMRQKECELLMAAEKADLLASQLSKHNGALENSSRRISALTRSEAELKAQVRQYVEKFRQVEETLGKSNDLFGTFRAEMEQMGAKLARLERENAQLNSKCATLSRNIIEMADERTKQNTTIDTLKGQKAKLEQLCRTLQAERNAALKSTSPAPPEEATVPSQ